MEELKVSVLSNFRPLGIWGAALAFLALIPSPGSAQSMQVTLSEGTNIAAAVSPDGRWIAFDLVGRIWRLPIEGGEAVPLTDHLGDARQPVWSPDGAEIAFQSYRDGNYHIWAVEPEGEGLRRITSGPFDHREPHWSPDGRRMAFSSDRSGTYDVWVMDLESGGMEAWSSGEGDEWGPAWSPDGARMAYAVAGEGPAGLMLREIDGTTRRLSDLDGRAEGISWSPDGSELTFVISGRGRADLARVTLDGPRASAPQVISEPGEDVFPFRATYTPGGDLVYTADGHIVRQPSGGGAAGTIPFRGVVDIDRSGYRRSAREFGDTGPMPVRGISAPKVSPDGSQVAFAAVGDLWIREANGSATRLTDDSYLESHPAWSPDGRSLAFASDRLGSMDIWVRDLATGQDRRLTTGQGAEIRPVYRPDGAAIAYQAQGGPDSGLRTVDVTTGEESVVTQSSPTPSSVSFSPDGRWMIGTALEPHSARFREGVNRVAIVNVETGEVRTRGDLAHLSIGTRGNDGPMWSPDGHGLAFALDGFLYLQPVGPTGEVAGPLKRLTDHPADALSWSADSRSVVYLANELLRRVDVDTGATEDLPLDLTFSRFVPDGSVVVHANRLFDGESPELRRNVDIVVDGNRIVRVVDHDEANHDDRVIDAGDGVVSPGLVEMHAHQGGGEAIGRQWLSWGVTAVRNPATDPYASLERREAIESGRRIGPRTFMSGHVFDGGRIYYGNALTIRTGAQVEAELDRAAALGYDLVKTYVRLPDALQEQVVSGAHERGIWVTSHELYPAVSYGTDGVEHLGATSRRGYSTKITNLRKAYQDVTALLIASKMAITPTLVLEGAFGVLTSRDPEEYFDDPRVSTFEGPDALEQNRRRAQGFGGGRGGGAGTASAAERLANAQRTLLEVVNGGGLVVAGTDSPIMPNGLSLHIEIEGYVDGGLTPFQAMQTATVNAARALGHEGQLGVIAGGALADLVILEDSPLDDIRNTRRVLGVMKNGVYYTLAELLRRPVS